jgi:hypothetical protein
MICPRSSGSYLVTATAHRDSDDVCGTPEECLNMMWQLTVDVWAFMGVDVAESEFPRHIVHIHRPDGS